MTTLCRRAWLSLAPAAALALAGLAALPPAHAQAFDKWIPPFGARVSLDDIEHGMLRKRGDYDDPRVHFAVHCASIGCLALPALAARYADQLADASAERERVRSGGVDIAFTDYGWALNDAR